MAKRFKQFLLENEIRYNDNNDSTIKNIIEQLPNNDATRMIIAKFVLYCVEDVFEFNNDTTRNTSRNCIDLIKRYINDPQSVTAQQLRNAAYVANVATSVVFDNVDTYAVNTVYVATYAAAHAAYYASNATYYAANAVIFAANATYTATNAATAVADTYAHTDNANIAERIREEKLNEYKQYLNMLTARYHYSDENTLHKINQLTQNKPETEQQWFSFLTNIIDELEVKNIIRQLPDGSAELHLPFANISANSQLELIDIISRNERIRDLIYSWFV